MNDTIEESAGGFRGSASPLLKQEGNRSSMALISNRANPSGLYRSWLRTTFTTDDYPMDSVDWNRTEIFKERLAAQKPNLRRYTSENWNSLQGAIPVFD
jgi:hypothetical protein